MIKERHKKFVILGELFVLSLVLWVINLQFPLDRGFFKLAVNPYFAASFIISAYYGRIYGFISLGFSLLFMAIPCGQDISAVKYWEQTFAGKYDLLAVILAGVYIFGVIQNSFTAVINKQRLFMKKIAVDKMKLKNELKGIEAVNREFEERVLLQNDSITALYSQINALHSQNLTKSLNILLSTVQKFTWAEKVSIWEYQKGSNSLVMIANIGWTAEDAMYSYEDADTSLSGWVVRNNKVFSVRMLLEHEAFSKMDAQRNIMTFPINLSNSTWGILNIESMPFSKYNLYIEKILSILVDLAGPAIEHAVEYEMMIKHADVHPLTGLPSPSQFMTVVEREIKKALERKGVFSIIILEVTDFDNIIQTYGESKAYDIILRLFDRLNEISGNQIDFFHYKKQNQFALFYPNTDCDGAALFCFESLGMITTSGWEIDDTAIDLEVIFGYSSMIRSDIVIEELLDSAEQLLEMQKV